MIHFKVLFSFILMVVLTIPVNENTMAWRDTYKLSWVNFKGEPQTNTDAVAVTASGITFSFSMSRSDSRIVDFSANVEAHFYPDKSWYNKAKADDYILAHEQLHFDITELHVRKFRKRISELKVSNTIKSELNRLHQSMNQELAIMQKLYDSESHNSINKEQQAKWETYVLNELKLLETFKSAD